MGSSSQETQSNSTQDTLRSTGEVTQEFIDTLPSVLSAVQKFQPQFSQAALEEFQQFAPQFAQTQQDVLNQFSPNQAGLGELLAGQAAQRSTEGLTQEELAFFSEQFSSRLGNQQSSPIGATAFSQALLGQQLGAKQQGQQLGLQLAGRIPITQATFQPQQFGVGQQFSNVFGQAAAQRFGGQSAQTSTTTPSALNQFGQFAGGFGGLLTGIGDLKTSFK